ncbi:MAG: hypothetical protein NVSMB45_02940 [Ginsengibacter sp.]
MLAFKASASSDPMVEKSKSYSKSYSVGNDKISLNNSFGEMKINTWSNNEIKVEVTMSAKAETDARAQELIDHIRIIDSKSNGEISFKTDLKDENGHKASPGRRSSGDKQNDEKFTINYVVYLPSSAKLFAENSFGLLIIGDFNGPLSIKSAFGSLNAGSLNQVEKLSVEFGKGTIQKIIGGLVEIKFSRAVINKLAGDLDVRLEFANGVKLNVDNDIRHLKLRANYTTVYLNVPNNLSADFDIKTKFGSLSNQTDFSIKEESNDDNQYGPKLEKRYKGKSGSGLLDINIDSQFGKVVLSHNVNFDVNDKHADK